MLLTHFVNLAAFDRLAIIVGVVELDLHHFHLGMLRQNSFQRIGLVMKRNAEVANLAFSLFSVKY